MWRVGDGHKVRSRGDGRIERRAFDRWPTDGWGVHYNLTGTETAGAGLALDISASGVLITTQTWLPAGHSVELSIHWPVLLHGIIPLNLIVLGVIVRSSGHQAAIAIRRYLFRERSFSGE